MTDRERLLEILNKPIFPHEMGDPLEAVADYLLDNGVTFHKWVPVALGFLPDENDVGEYMEKYSYAPEFIVMIKGSCEATTLQYDGELWSDEYGNTYNVTHWMPLPEPPKEDV